jgi:hypothetical protein
MTHLSEEDIARLIDGKVSEAERKRMLDHMADCDSCLSIYSETVRFLEEEGELREVVDLDEKGSGSIINMSRRAWIPVAAMILIAIIAYPFLKQILPSDSLSDAVIAHHEARLETIGSGSGHQFADPNNKIYAAIRIGMWMEDLDGLTSDGKQKKNTGKYIDLLIQDLERFLPADNPLLKEVADLNEDNFRDAEVKVLLSMKNHDSGELYQLGRFIEKILLTAIDGELPVIEELQRFLNIAKKFELPQGVHRRLSQLSDAREPGEFEDIAENIIYTFVE